VLQVVSARQLGTLAHDGEFLGILARCQQARTEMRTARPWFEESGATQALGPVAFFSMEFGLSEALPIYAGGLGVLGGDYLKAASDLGVPVVGVGILYTEGYFRQILERDGSQRELYPPNDPGELPIMPARDADGERIRIPIEFPGRTVFARTWVAQVGRTQLYLLDCNDPANQPADRGITARLYGGSDEERLQQEVVLGIGGWRLLTALGVRPEICHLNEGHAALASIERTRAIMAEMGLPFNAALRLTRSGTLFTTHTPIAAAFDRFDAGLATKYLAPHARAIGIDVEDLLALGRREPNSAEPLNMAYLAVRCSGGVNGVSRLHGEVSRTLFSPLFPRHPIDDVPVGYVTNGVHTPSWDSADADALWTAACGSERWRGDLRGLAEKIEYVGDADLWSMRNSNRRRLVERARRRLTQQLGEIGAPESRVADAAETLDPDVLTLGFARRFTGYKRTTLLLRDPDRLARLLTSTIHPMQLVLAGKAHPRDEEGKAMIRAWLAFGERPDVRGHVAFLNDYDLLLAEELVQGCDVWINTPRRPLEASGTSGMKVLVNGGLNLSELDGWWAEAYEPDVGWAFGNAQSIIPDEGADAEEADALYGLLENEIGPRFYTRDRGGSPTAWIASMRASMKRLTGHFSTNRMLREYVEEKYLSAAAAYRKRSAGDGALARTLEAAVTSLERHWGEIAIGSSHTETATGPRLIRVDVRLGAIDPSLVRVELYAEMTGSHPREIIVMRPAPAEPGMYECTASMNRPLADYTPRVVPNVPDLALPLECGLISWQR
jgi:starch phosphorylase